MDLLSASLGNYKVSIIGVSIHTMDSNRKVTHRQVGVSGSVTTIVAFTIYIIIWCASAVVILEVDGSCGTEIDIKFVQVIIIGHIRWLNVDLVMTWVST